MILTKTAFAFAVATVLAPLVFAQRGGPDWTTAAGDPQRTSWVRYDPGVTPAKIVKPDGFKFLWKVSMDTTKGMASEPIEISTYIGYRGFKALTVVAGPDSIYTVDYDLGVPFWSQHYGTATRTTGCAARPAAIGKLSSLTAHCAANASAVCRVPHRHRQAA